MTNNPSENIWDKFTKTSKVEPFMESLNADFFQFSAKIIKSFTLSSYNLGQKIGDKLTNLSKIGSSMECFTADFLWYFTKKC